VIKWEKWNIDGDGAPPSESGLAAVEHQSGLGPAVAKHQSKSGPVMNYHQWRIEAARGSHQDPGEHHHEEAGHLAK
jgi:hypothetical protein